MLKTQDLPKARAYLNMALADPTLTSSVRAHIHDALMWMKKTNNKHFVRRNPSFTWKMKRAIQQELAREALLEPEQQRQDVEIALSLGYSAAAAARVSEVRNGVR